ncbi:MAG: ROK family protein [Anaerolineae bacterium]|nr:ROK family protein [Candidatus Roseilinea sp.]MDW8451185.1 ROK family protein [Anaerolineae bacterium]
MSEHRVVAVDLGGTNIRAALCTSDGAICKRVRQPTCPEQGVEAVIARIVASIQAVMPESGEEVVAVGVASPGPLDPYTGVVLFAANLHWQDVPLRDLLSRRLGLPVCIGNDANLAALGEQKYGAGRGVRDMAYVTISTGIGAGVILDDRLILGHRGMATEIGHMVLNFDGPIDHAGVPGSLEGYAAGPGIAHAAQARLAAGVPSLMRELAGGDIAAITAREVVQAAEQGDPLALEVLAWAARIIGLGLVNLLHLFDPALIVVGGSVGLASERLLDMMRETIQRHAMPPYRGVPLVRAQLGDDSGLLGAAALAWQQVLAT